VIRLLFAAGLALAVTGCAAAEQQGFTPELPPTVAPVAEPSASAAPEAPVVGRPVPASAVLAPTDLGAGWTSAAPTRVACSSGLPARPSRTAGVGDGRGTLTETVTSGADVAAAVAQWRSALARCGWSVSDYALGDAGLDARSTDGAARVVVTGAEGVVVLLHARGGLVRATDELDGWADLALGTSCAAAPDGCH
jgi:hypothetical protein